MASRRSRGHWSETESGNDSGKAGELSTSGCPSVNHAVLCDVLIGLCLELAVLWMYKMIICMLPSAVEEVKKLDNNEEENDKF